MGHRGRLIVVSGPSGVGKGTVVSRLLERLDGAQLSISVTTRRPREGEADGVDYLFVDDDTFDAMVEDGELLEWATYAGNRYGTPQGPVDQALRSGRDILLEIEVQGAVQVRSRRPDATLVFLRPPSEEELERRLTERGTEDGEERALRMATARAELEAAEGFDHQVVNDDLDRCVREIASIIARERRDGTEPVSDATDRTVSGASDHPEAGCGSNR